MFSLSLFLYSILFLFFFMNGVKGDTECPLITTQDDRRSNKSTLRCLAIAQYLLPIDPLAPTIASLIEFSNFIFSKPFCIK